MKRYEPKLPRTLFALISIAMTGVTLAVMVVWPALETQSAELAYTVTVSVPRATTGS
jgi:hypothetical protein